MQIIKDFQEQQKMTTKRILIFIQLKPKGKFMLPSGLHADTESQIPKLEKLKCAEKQGDILCFWLKIEHNSDVIEA